MTALGDRDVVPWLAGLRHRLSPEQVATVVEAVEELLPGDADGGAELARPRSRGQ